MRWKLSKLPRLSPEIIRYTRAQLGLRKTNKEEEKAGSTLRTSQAVPHPSTIRALSRLTSEVERDPVYSTRYGRQRIQMFFVDWYFR